MRPIDFEFLVRVESGYNLYQKSGIASTLKQPKPRFVLQQSQDSDELAANDKKENSVRRGDGSSCKERR